MKRSSAVVLQAAIVVGGVAVFAYLLLEPLVEGRNAHATLFQVYFEDAFLACAYAAAVPFFVALGQAFGLLDAMRRNGTLPPRASSAVRTIGSCALAIIGFVGLGEAYLLMIVRGKDDIAGGVSMGVLVALLSAAIAAAAALFGRALQRQGPG